MSQSKSHSTNPYPFWAPRFWHGMRFSTWIRLLAQHGKQIHPSKLGLVATISLFSTFNSKMRIAQNALFGHAIKQRGLSQDPLFIVGHWRSGTTLLHELLSHDIRFSAPTTYQCFAANHFLLTQDALTTLLWWMLPSKRPMDNVAAGWNAPQEDEFAMCSLGFPSPYLRMAFPNSSQEYLEYLNLDIDQQSLKEWAYGLDNFIRHVTYRSGKPLILKSPTHTGRLHVLGKLYPNAKFIHISRDPYAIVPSTLRLWKSLDEVQALQVPQHADLESYVHRAFHMMYDSYFRSRTQFPSDRLIEIRYEDLVTDGIGTLEKIYDQLQLGNFESTRNRLDQVVKQKQDFQRNQHTLDATLIRNINSEWEQYFSTFHYDRRSPDIS